MEQIDDCCHRFERLRQQRHHHHQHMCTIQQNDPHIPTVAFQSLDTVRALHQTVVSLRKALEEANREIDTLKKQINVHDDIEEGKKYRDLELSQENLLNIDLTTIDQQDQNDQYTNQINSETYRCAPIILNENDNKSIDLSQSHRSTKSLNESSRKIIKQSSEHFEHHVKTQDIQHKQLTGLPIKADIYIKKSDIHRTDTSIQSTNQRTPQMASKIDVKIKLTSNFQIDGSESSSETTGSNSGKLFFFVFAVVEFNSFSV